MLIADSAFVGFVSWAPTFLRQDLAMLPDAAGYLFGASTALGAAGIVVMGYAQDRFDGKKVILANSLASALLSFTLLTEKSTVLIAPTLLLSGFFMNCFWTLISAQAQKSVSELEVGSATGVVQNFGMVGAIIGPALIGWMAEAASLSTALIVAVSGFYLVSAILTLFYRRTLDAEH
jgi:sugar phosphate permease